MWHGYGTPIFAGWDETESTIKCPNCGSASRIELVDTTESESTVLEVYQCRCGAKVHRFLKIDIEVYFSPTGTIMGKKKY